MADQPTIYVDRAGKTVRVWTCDVCRQPFEWREGSSVYGTLRDEDAGHWDRLKIFCSPGCRAAAGPLPVDPSKSKNPVGRPRKAPAKEA